MATDGQQHPTQRLLLDLGTTVSIQWIFLCVRLPARWILPLGRHPAVHVLEGRLHRCDIHAHEMGTHGTHCDDTRTAGVTARIDWHDGRRR